ncbi:MAG: YjbQ family protein [Opitutales bacterium]|jgi:secondary thiamine-phosphate synthase enzyme|nr:YjbQ family protein [Opitutales bacterium]MDG2256590.1 secondary thiamine-phosphate synthase enzyme YjbQ [Opitutaceae bacterium]MBT5170468.1 YjbQ family protein [Opitutales bacterium]MBT5813146.1 YjbQ family protein [Opitutales bacterium]MBT6380905.1 YjbQ family protein [Opitutales bacterium]
MAIFQTEIKVHTSGQGTYEVSDKAHNALSVSGLQNGTLSIFCRHTSCSLVLMENADASARSDLEAYMGRLVPENDPLFTHTYEGPDDMPSHIKMALTRSSETIPFSDSQLLLGTWQGLFLWEHRYQPHTRSLIITLTGE